MRLEAAIQLDPQNYRPFLLLAKAHTKLGHMDASDRAVNMALCLRSDVPDIYIALGNNAPRRKCHGETAIAFARAVELVGNSSAGLLAAQAWALSCARRQKEAERIAREALSRFPHPLAYRTMAGLSGCAEIVSVPSPGAAKGCIITPSLGIDRFLGRGLTL